MIGPEELLVAAIIREAVADLYGYKRKSKVAYLNEVKKARYRSAKHYLFSDHGESTLKSLLDRTGLDEYIDLTALRETILKGERLERRARVKYGYGGYE